MGAQGAGGRWSRHLNIAYHDERSTLRLQLRGPVSPTGLCHLVAALGSITVTAEHKRTESGISIGRKKIINRGEKNTNRTASKMEPTDCIERPDKSGLKKKKKDNENQLQPRQQAPCPRQKWLNCLADSQAAASCSPGRANFSFCNASDV